MTWAKAGIAGSIISLITVLVNVWIGKSTKRLASADAALKIEQACKSQVERVNLDNDRLINRCETLQKRLDEFQDQD